MLDGWDARVQAALLREVGARVTGILDTTRDMIQQEVERGLNEGLSPGALADNLEDAAAFSEYRSELIARTESATFLNQAALANYDEFGVTHVEVIDGEGDDECAAANGQIWTLEEANANPIAHPNCVRDFVPVLDGRTATEESALVETPVGSYPPPDTSPTGVEAAAKDWTGGHTKDIRAYQEQGQLTQGLHLETRGERAAQDASTLTRLIRDGEQAPPLYRGLTVNDDIAAQFRALQPGQSQDMVISSWSASREQAVQFASRGGNPVILQVDNAQGFNIAPYSSYPGEQEWITNGRFTVESVEQRGQTLVVTYRQEAVFDMPKSGIKAKKSTILLKDAEFTTWLNKLLGQPLHKGKVTG